jgi:hypothetical protein
MAIFGTSYCKLSGSIELELNHSTLTPIYIIPDEIEFISDITGHKSFANTKMHYSVFDIDVNLFKYENNADDVFNSLTKLKNEQFYFYPHVDGPAIKDIYENNILFHIIELVPYYLLQPNQYDAIKLRMVSTAYTYLGTNVYTGGYGTNYGQSPYGSHGW